VNEYLNIFLIDKTLYKSSNYWHFILMIFEIPFCEFFYIFKFHLTKIWHWKKTRHTLSWVCLFYLEWNMATYNLDTESTYTAVTIDWQEYMIGIIQNQETIKQEIQNIDETNDLQDQWIAIVSKVLSQFNDKVSLTKARESEIYKVILLLIQQLSWK